MIHWIKLLTDYNIPYHTHGPKISHGWIGVKCYTCSDSTGSKLGLNLNSGACTCWSCGGKPPLEAISYLLRLPNDKARLVYRQYTISINKSIIARKRTKGSADSLSIPNNPLTDRALNYLKKRDIGSKYFRETYDMRFGGISGDFAHRIILSIFFNGEAVSATARTIHPGVEPKYWTLPPEREVIYHKSILYNWDMVEDTAILVEGPVDSIKGGPGFVSSFGAQMTEEQLLLLSTKKYVKVLFDSDDTGVKQGDAYAHYLSALGVDVELIKLKDFHDLGEMPLDEIRDLRIELGMDGYYE